MVSYGTSDFRSWADGNGLNDHDLVVIRRKAKWNMLLWFVLPALTLGFGSLFCAPLLFNAYRVSRWIKKGTLDPGVGLTGLVLYLFLFISFFAIIPLIVWVKIKDDPDMPGSGMSKLYKKGKIGGH